MTFTWSLVVKNFRAHEALQNKLGQKIAKLERHLEHFPPEAVHLQIHLEKHTKRDLFLTRLTLRLPSNILHSEKSAADPIPAFDKAFKALLREVASLKADLRGEEKWKSKLRRAQLHEAKPLRFAELPLARGQKPQAVADPVLDLFQREQARLIHFVRRQLWNLQLEGSAVERANAARDVVDAIARQLAHAPVQKPERLSYRAWFYQLARAALDRRIKALTGESRETAPPPRAAARPESVETAEAGPPRALLDEETEPTFVPASELVADTYTASPDEAATEHDVLDYLHRQAAAWPARERAVFELHFLEGFDVDEVAMLEGIKPGEAETLIAAIQERLRALLREATEVVATRPPPPSPPRKPTGKAAKVS